MSENNFNCEKRVCVCVCVRWNSAVEIYMSEKYCEMHYPIIDLSVCAKRFINKCKKIKQRRKKI